MAITQRTKLHLEVGLADKDAAAEVASKLEAQAATVAAIAVPASADAEDCALKVNEVIAALKAAGLMAT